MNLLTLVLETVLQWMISVFETLLRALEENVGHEQQRRGDVEPARPAWDEPAVREGVEEDAEGHLPYIVQEVGRKPEPGMGTSHVIELDADPWLLNVENGTLDLRSGELRDHHGEDLMTKLVPVCYVSGARAPVWEAFLERVLPSEGLRRFVRRAITLRGT
jgi:hypothetical protein